MELLYCILIGYFIGCINPSFFLGKLRGVDIKKSGSGNAGASNALILFGKLTGVFCALFDIFKAWFAVWISAKLFETYVYTFVVTSVSAILGHIFPFYMRFRGGKGLACFGGMVLYYDWRVFLIMLACAVVFVLIVNYICFVPITASLVFPVIYGLQSNDTVGALILLIPAAVILFKHIENLKRIAAGTEFRVSFLWNKQKELDRLNLKEDEMIVETESECVK